MEENPDSPVTSGCTGFSRSGQRRSCRFGAARVNAAMFYVLVSKDRPWLHLVAMRRTLSACFRGDLRNHLPARLQVVHSLLCVPSQIGADSECLHPQKKTRPSFSAVYFNGVNSVTL